MRRKRVLILGAGGRDFHNFNVVFRDNPNFEVVGFTASQIPGIVGRRYPPELAGNLYPNGVPILPEDDMEKIVSRLGVDIVVLAYSDLTYSDVGEKLSRALAAGASFMILGPRDTMLESSKPVIAVTAVRTGAGKSTVSRALVREFSKRQLRVAPIRHPMAYKDLARMAVQVFEELDDLDRYGVTVEEREEYEHYIRLGFKVYAGVDYGRILQVAERDADIILWDGGNNDWPFIRPDYMITVADAMRPGQEVASFPGEVNVRMADVVIINKADQARPEDVDLIKRNVSRVNPRAKIAVAESVVTLDKPELVRNRRVVVLEDSPTVTHGGAPYAAGYVAALKYGAAEIVDPRPYAVGIIKEMYEKYKHMSNVIPSTGYNERQLKDLEETINRIPADAVILGTPADITRLIKINKPVARVSFEVKIVEGPSISEIVDEFLDRVKSKLG